METWKGTQCSDCRGVRGPAGCALSRGVCSRRVSPWREVVTIPVFAESTFLCWVPQLGLNEGQRGAVGGSGRLGGDPPRSRPGPHWSLGGGHQGGGFRSGAAGSHCLAAASRGSGCQRGKEGPARMLREPGRGCQGATGGGWEGPGHALWSLVGGLDVSRTVVLEP